MTPEGFRPARVLLRAVLIGTIVIVVHVVGPAIFETGVFGKLTFRNGGVIESAHAVRPARLLAGFVQTQAIIETSRNLCIMLNIYLSDTPAQHARGLMYVEQMDEFEGMLFRYRGSAGITMWMKNTYIALDMLFIREDGSIAGLEKQTTPLSTRRISSPEPVQAVLEVNGGFTDRWHILPDNRILAIN